MLRNGNFVIYITQFVWNRGLSDAGDKNVHGNKSADVDVLDTNAVWTCR
jgi:hypothetical protein